MTAPVKPKACWCVVSATTGNPWFAFLSRGMAQMECDRLDADGRYIRVVKYVPAPAKPKTKKRRGK